MVSVFIPHTVISLNEVQRYQQPTEIKINVKINPPASVKDTKFW